MQTRQSPQVQEANTLSHTHTPAEQQATKPRTTSAHPTTLIQRAAANPRSLTRAETLQLQRTMGNRAVGRLLRIQAKLMVGPSGDKYEREADQVASQVVQHLDIPSISSHLQRYGASADGYASTDLADAVSQARGSGRPLDATLQRSMEPLIGADLSKVRIHTDMQADRLSRSLQAQAFTTGRDVFFRQGVYQPRSQGGQSVLAHELVHVVQQGGAPMTHRSTDQPHTGVEAIESTLQHDAPLGQPDTYIQRKLSWQNTDWTQAKNAWSSTKGSRGVVFVTDNDTTADPVVVKTGEDAPAELVLAANLHSHATIGEGRWQRKSPGVRAVDKKEGTKIKWNVEYLLRNDSRGKQIIQDADKPGTMVFEYVSGKGLSDLIQGTLKHSRKVGVGRGLREDSPFRLFTDNDFVTSLGTAAAFDIFLGNFDRLAGSFNPENFMVDAQNHTIQMIDNVQMSAYFSFKTWKKGSQTQTGDQSFQAWKQHKLTQYLQGGQYDALATEILDRIKDMIDMSGAAMSQVTLRQEDKASIKTALGKADVSGSLVTGLKYGMRMLHDMNQKPDLTAGIAAEDVNEVQDSMKKRFGFLFS